MLYGILNILFGGLALSPSLSAESKHDKYLGVLGWAGIIVLLYGIMGVASSLMYVETLSTSPLYWILWITGGISNVLIGATLVAILIKRRSGGSLKRLFITLYSAGITAIFSGVIQLFVQS